MARALFGLAPVASGRIRIAASESLLNATPAFRIRQRFGYLSEDRKGEGLALPMSVADNLMLTGFHSCARRGWLNLAAQREQARQWIEALRVRTRTPDQPVRTLSGGNQQKVALGRLLHQDADILLLDEPTRGVDIGSKAQIYEIVADAAARNKAVLLISSYLPELFGLCDRLAVMSRGRLSDARPIGEWTPERVLHIAVDAQPV